jgi:hypothetical protein
MNNPIIGRGTVKNNYQTIAQAIEAAEAGEIITIYPETYSESIALVKDITLNCLPGVVFTSRIEKASGTSKIVGAKIVVASGPAVLITGGELLLEDCQVRATENVATAHGIRIDGGSVMISECKIFATHADAYSLYSESAGSAVVKDPCFANRDISGVTLSIGELVIDTDLLPE